MKRRKKRIRASGPRPSPGAAKNGGRVPIAEQWVEVRVKNGRTVTDLTPSNAELSAEIEELEPAVELVYRRINFPHGIPSEYHWVTQDAKRREYGGCGIQRMTVEGWRRQLELELGAEHLKDTPELMPRPEEHGSCDCPACRDAERRLAG